LLCAEVAVGITSFALVLANYAAVCMCCVAAVLLRLQRGRPVQVRWVNELADDNKRYRPHMFADQLDQTLHW
jgi:hypothetical protein